MSRLFLYLYAIVDHIMKFYRLLLSAALVASLVSCNKDESSYIPQHLTPEKEEEPEEEPADEPMLKKAFSAELSNDIIYSKGVQLYKRGNIMQGFDFTDATHFYYSQSPNGDTQYISFSPGPSKPFSSYMALKNFGHMTQIVAESASDGKTYIWCNSNGIMTESNTCDNNLSFSRVEFRPGATIEGGYDGDTFFMTKKYNGSKAHMDLQVSIDFDARRLLLGTRVSGVAIRFFWVYDLDKALGLPIKDITVTIDGEPRTVRGRDLADLETLGYFEIPRGQNDSQEYYNSHQGHEVHGDEVWFYEGQVNGGSSSVAYVTIHDYNGKVVFPRTAIKAITDNARMKELGFSNDGYAEGESIKVKGSYVYLGIAAHSAASSSNRIQNILRYKFK